MPQPLHGGIHRKRPCSGFLLLSSGEHSHDGNLELAMADFSTTKPPESIAPTYISWSKSPQSYLQKRPHRRSPTTMNESQPPGGWQW
ncbi:MAG: hypothetical protein KC413_21825, partial [Anaerolineales bacterium]|nr:hypothetical protein [Anaerolineales bacterium]